MIGLGEHAEFIIAAYVGVFSGLVVLIGWTIYAARRSQQRLKELGDTRSDAADQ
ncbi:heme exporter protein CcmD [Devosia soli]|uniref:heme exporter protein CcmD n=1 Tax=Devosia soli TaxID=361041 RepID=UPI000A7EB3B1|nr:heme exporter protein CcmD [Devosia soli]